jgi:uncharacterized protein (DUF433 family)
MNALAEQTGRGMYPLGDAARLAHLPALTVRRWIEGYDYKHRGERRRSQPIAYLDHASNPRGVGQARKRPKVFLDFEELLTLLLVEAFHRKGLSLPKIKKAAARARDVYQLENPFASAQFRSDGNKTFIDLAPRGRGKERELVDLLSDQRQFHEIVEPSLFKDVVFMGERAGEWWPLGKDHSVVLDPRRQFGAPHIKGTGVRTDVIAQMVTAEGGGAEAVAATADWFGLGRDQVVDAVEFEGRWLAEPID